MTAHTRRDQYRAPLVLTDRRRFLNALTIGMAALAVPGVFAEQLTRTPRQTEGPFYPDRLPLDTDNDLIVINNAVTPAVGEITHLTGRVLDERGAPVPNALVEIWQCDRQGVYIHTQDVNRAPRDSNFQGYGRFLTGSAGEYYFRTIKPVPYPGRTPHIHVKVSRGGRELLTTQCYVKGEAGNERDGIWLSLKNARDREALTIPFAPMQGSPMGELSARFDVVLGLTPASA
jgi:protocatechuate 3,4-dioxygenase beta subunit